MSCDCRGACGEAAQGIKQLLRMGEGFTMYFSIMNSHFWTPAYASRPSGRTSRSLHSLVHKTWRPPTVRWEELGDKNQRNWGHILAGVGMRVVRYVVVRRVLTRVLGTRVCLYPASGKKDVWDKRYTEK